MSDKEPERKPPQVKYRSLIKVDNGGFSTFLNNTRTSAQSKMTKKQIGAAHAKEVPARIGKRQFPFDVVDSDNSGNKKQLTEFAFNVIEHDFRCKICQLVINGNTPFGLTQHISFMHPEEQEIAGYNWQPVVHRRSSKFLKSHTNIFNEVPTELDQAICNFLTKFGLSSDTVRDGTFMKMILSVGKDRSLPNPAAVEKSLSFDCNKPTSITIDFVKQKTAFYLAFSIHHFNEVNMRISSVFLRKLASLDPSTEDIIMEIRKILKIGIPPNKMFKNIVSTNSIHEKGFYETGSVENSYICYFSYISNFAEAVIRIKRFQDAFEKLRNFITVVKNSSSMYSRLETFLSTPFKEVFDLPESDLTKWTGTTTFLEQVLHLHPRLKVFCNKNNVQYGFDDSDHAELTYFQPVLSQLKSSVKKLSKPDSLISLVIPEIVELEKCIINCGDRGTTIELTYYFEKNLAPLLSGYRGGCYSYATLLDPRLGFDNNIFSAKKWIDICNSLKASLETTFVHNLRDNCFFDVDKQLEKYRILITTNRPDSFVDPFVWWNENSSELTCLVDKARLVLSPPPCAIDSEYYFGKRGKFNNLSGKMEYKVFNKWLEVAGWQEKFRGRGCPENEKVQLEPVTINFQMPKIVHAEDQGAVINSMLSDAMRNAKSSGYQEDQYYEESEQLADLPSTSSENFFVDRKPLAADGSLFYDEPMPILENQTLEMFLMGQPLCHEEILVTCGRSELDDDIDTKEVKQEVNDD